MSRRALSATARPFASVASRSSLATSSPLLPRPPRIWSSQSPVAARQHRHFADTTTTPAFTSPASDAANAVDPPPELDAAELAIFQKLKAELQPTALEVKDISGGCGSMYGLYIASPRFQHLSVVKQHQLVNKILAEEIKGWHGVQLRTQAS